MSRQKNGMSFKKTVNKFVAFGAALFFMTGTAGSLAAACDPCFELPFYQDPCCSDPCFNYFNCEMPDFAVYADFLYWQVHPEGLEFARNGGFGAAATTKAERGRIESPDCELEPGFRIGVSVDLDYCDWDFYAQYTYLEQCFHDDIVNPFVAGTGAGSLDLQPLIYNQEIGPDAGEPLSLARAEWDADFNVLDFGFSRTFSVDNCFYFRPHLGFKATWQELKYNVRYERAVSTTATMRTDIRNKTEFDGIGLRGGCDAAWKFSPCISLVGGFAISSVWSDIETSREDFHTPALETSIARKNVNLTKDRCALIPVTELLFGLRYDTIVCRHDVFVFVGWENQAWFNLNRFIFVENSELVGNAGSNSIQFGPHGTITYQGVTVRVGCDY